MSPPITSAQVLPSPATIPVAPLTPATSTGTWLSIFAPLPSSPKSPLPQHLTAPPAVSAQLSPTPAAMAVTPPPRPTTPTADGRAAVEAVPDAAGQLSGPPDAPAPS